MELASLCMLLWLLCADLLSPAGNLYWSQIDTFVLICLMGQLFLFMVDLHVFLQVVAKLLEGEQEEADRLYALQISQEEGTLVTGTNTVYMH